jgi:hypothetical protein
MHANHPGFPVNVEISVSIGTAMWPEEADRLIENHS